MKLRSSDEDRAHSTFLLYINTFLFVSAEVWGLLQPYIQ